MFLLFTGMKRYTVTTFFVGFLVEQCCCSAAFFGTTQGGTKFGGKFDCKVADLDLRKWGSGGTHRD